MELDAQVRSIVERGKFFLASKSPRRKDILEQQLHLAVEVFPSGFPENLDKLKTTPVEYVVDTASEKCLDVYKSVIDSDIPPSIVLAADTVALAGNKILEKPRSAEQHFAMLKHLRDIRVHKVITGIACLAPFEEPVHPGYTLQTHLEESEVVFKSGITDEQILEYIKSGEADDAAGGYKIQGELGKEFIETTKGDYYNIVGLPVEGTVALITRTIHAAMADDSESD